MRPTKSKRKGSGNMKYLVTILALGAISITGCSEATNADDTSTSSTDTTTEKAEVGIGAVEDAFAANIQKRGDKIAEEQSEGPGLDVYVYVKEVNCKRVSEGRATCYVHNDIVVGGTSRPDTTVWNVTYDLEDGHPLAYHSR